MRALLVLFVVALALAVTAGLLGIARQVADTIPTCVVPTATGCPDGPTP